MARTRDYRAYLRGIGRRSIPKGIRTTRRAGDVEIVRDPRTGEDRLHRFDGEGKRA